MGRHSITQANAIRICLKLPAQAHDSVFGSVVLSYPKDGNQNQGEPQRGHCQQEAQSSAQIGRQVGRRRHGTIESKGKGAINDNLVFSREKSHHCQKIYETILHLQVKEELAPSDLHHPVWCPSAPPPYGLYRIDHMARLKGKWQLRTSGIAAAYWHQNSASVLRRC